VTAARCPVCRSAGARPFVEVAAQRYWRCGTCEATFLEAGQRPGPAAERAHYRTHRNDAADPGYRRFVARLVAPLCARLPPAGEVLDFGCGASSAVAALLRAAGHRVRLYDPCFQPDAAALERAYDAVAACEVIEHLQDPATTLARLGERLRPGGWLALMTCFQTDDARFATWWYRRDPTHVVFYREATLAHVAARLGLRCEVPRKDVALMQRPA